ncbi:plexin-A4-like [Planococcus citri]|uniref:plexin-A4-like n=1 Tax=Planococcus citri TaxID=170843 RepID=UPI0031F9A7F5
MLLLAALILHMVLGNVESLDNDTIIRHFTGENDSKHSTLAIDKANPMINKLTPPLQGIWYTTVLIEGINLCSPTISNICNITVAGLPCIPMVNSPNYNPPKVIQCQMNQTIENPEFDKTGPVVVHMGTISAISPQNFTLIVPKMISILPKQGPLSGGTELTLKGNFIDDGSVEVDIDKIACEVFFKNTSLMKCRTPALHKSMNCYMSKNCNVSVTFKKNPSVNFRNGEFKFNYLEDPNISRFDIEPPKSIPAGGIQQFIFGKNFDSIQKPLFYIYNEDMTKRYESECKVWNSGAGLICLTPDISDIDSSSFNKNNPIRLNYGFVMDNVAHVQNISMNTSHKNFTRLMLYPNPTFKSSNEEIKTSSIGNDEILIIEGENVNLACRETEIIVKVGDRSCETELLTPQRLNCHLPPPNSLSKSDEIGDEPLNVTVHIGSKLQVIVGKYNVKSPRESMIVDEYSVKSSWDSMSYILYGGGIIVLIIIISITVTFTYKKFSKKSRDLKKVYKRLNELELGVAKECKAAFTDLQTEITDLTTNFKLERKLPFVDYHTYVMNIIFPGIKDHSIILNETLEILDKEQGLQLFNQLLLNKTFLLLFVQTLENHVDFSMSERTQVASMMMITLQNDMQYCTNIIKTMISQLIGKYVRGNNDPKLMFRQGVGIVEKMLSIWFSFLLHGFLKANAGEPLYRLFCAIKQHVNKGPIDAVTSNARHSLSEDKIIRQDFGDFKMMTIHVTVPLQTALLTGLKSIVVEELVKVLDCDTISQVKEKAIDVIYADMPYSQRPDSSSTEIEWIDDKLFTTPLFDYDSTSKIEHEWRRLNTLHHYGIPDFSKFNLVSAKIRSISNASTLRLNKVETPGLTRTTRTMKSIKKKIVNSLTAPNTRPNETNHKTWHLVKPEDHCEINCNSTKKDTRGDKLVSEIYLTRLLATKSILQKFVDDLFATIFDAKREEKGPPLAVKYLFDFLDSQASHHGITDPDVVHAWKNNCLPLRYWVNLIKNPDFIFDIHKSNVVDSCLSVIAQAFMDSCSTSDNLLSKNSPASKLLYAKDIPINRKRVKKYYSDIKSLPVVHENDMNAMLNEKSHLHECEFNTNWTE